MSLSLLDRELPENRTRLGSALGCTATLPTHFPGLALSGPVRVMGRGLLREAGLVLGLVAQRAGITHTRRLTAVPNFPSVLPAAKPSRMSLSCQVEAKKRRPLPCHCMSTFPHVPRHGCEYRWGWGAQGKQWMGNAAVNRISRPTCSGRDSPVGTPSHPRAPHPSTALSSDLHCTWK